MLLDKNTSGKAVVGILCLVCISFLVEGLHAQQDSQYTQYMYNTETINPAYAGTKGYLSFLGLYRSQWVGLEGAPETISFTMDSPIGDNERTGLGLSFVQDRIGPTDESTVTADFSYAVLLDKYNDLKLAFGLKGGVNLLNVDYAKLSIENPNDALQQNNIENRLKPVVGLGAYLYNPNWYFGASIPNLLETKYYDQVQVSYASKRAVGYIIGGYVFRIDRSIRFKPAFLTKVTPGAPLALDVSANFLFDNNFTIGAAYRLNSSISALAGFQISENIMIGYAYDYGTNVLADFNSGSHELFLKFDLFRDRRGRLINPRFF